MKVQAIILTLLALPCVLHAADKGSYTFFHPTPRDEMREMNSDRPDATEGPYTIDAGHLQIETSFFEFGRDGDVKDYSFGETNFRLGLTNRTDLELIVPFFERESGSDAPDHSGIGDLTVRMNWNLWGDDGGDTAFSIMPFVKTPTASHRLGNDKVEGGVILPLSVSINDRAGVTVMAALDVAYDEVRDNYGADFVNSASFSIAWTEKLGSYFEFVSVSSTRADADWEGYGNTGITFAVTGDIILDAGITVGLVNAAQDFGVVTGISVRF